MAWSCSFDLARVFVVREFRGGGVFQVENDEPENTESTETSNQHCTLIGHN